MADSNPAAQTLARLRKKAQSLLRAARDGEPSVLERLRAVPRLGTFPTSAIARSVQLADCEDVIAREVGAESWSKLQAQLENLDPRVIPAEQVLMHLAEGEVKRARVLLNQYPDLGPVNLFVAAATGDVEMVEQFLAAGPASPKHPRNQWTPLLYLAASPLHADSLEASEDFLETARLLLDAGADPNEHTLWSEEEGKSRLTALYRAVLANNVPLVRLLLERGADPNDGESIFHGAELNHRDCLELLLAHGANISQPDPHWGKTPLHFLAGYQESHPHAKTAVLGMAWLLEKGADPNVQRADGRTPFQLAVRAGHQDAMTFLAARGADPDSARPIDHFLGHAMQGDEPAARKFLDAGDVSISNLPPDDLGLLVQAVHDRNFHALETLIHLGFDPGWESPWGGTALHAAAWLGQVELVRRLLALGAPVNIRDSRFGSSPLAWAAHGSTNSRKADDDYVAIIDLLLDAGSNREMSINKWNEPPESMASARVAEHLRKRLATLGGGPGAGDDS